MRRQFEKKIEQVEKYTQNITKNQILENIDLYNVDIKIEKNTDEYPLRKEFSKFIIHKKEQNKNILYRDINENHCYIMYDNNYSSIEYDLLNNIITCYGDNNKPCFVHSLNDNVQTWFEYDHNDNILYSYDTEGNSYMNFYTYYGELLVNETFDKRLIKEIEKYGDTKTITYIVDESERFNRHDGVILILKYKNNELISYKSAFYKWDKKYGINQPNEIDKLYYIGDSYIGSPISYIEVSELKKFRNSGVKKYKYRELTRYQSRKSLLNESSKLSDTYIIEYFIHDDQGRKIWGEEGHLNKKSGKEEHNLITIDYKMEEYEEYNDDYKECIVSKKHINSILPYVECIYNNAGGIWGLCCIKEQHGGSKYYNKYGILISDGDGKEYDNDGYILSERHEYLNRYPDEFDIIHKEYVYNDNKIIVFKHIYDNKYKNIIETFKYNDNGKLLYYEKEYLDNKNPRKKEIQIYEYDKRDRVIHEYLIINNIIEYEAFKKYNDTNNLVKITSYTLKEL